MKIVFYLFITIFLLTACNTEVKQNSIRKKYRQLQPLLAAADSMGFRDKAAILIKTIQLSQTDTSLANTIIERAILPKDGTDSVFNFYATELDLLKKKEICLSNGEINNIDTTNKHVLAYTCSKGNASLLIACNMDEDNYALEHTFDYPNMQILFCNYDFVAPGPVSSSLALRPYEVRILRIN